MSEITRLLTRAGNAVVDAFKSDRSLEAEAMERQAQLSGLAVARRDARERQRDLADGHLIGRYGELVELRGATPLKRDAGGTWRTTGVS